MVNIGNGGWLHAESLGAIADVCPPGTNRFPLYIIPAVAREWFEIWKFD